MKRLIQFPFGAMLFAAYPPFVLWERLTDVFSLAEAFRAGLILALIVLAVLALLTRLSRLRREATLGLSLLFAAALAPSGLWPPVAILLVLLVLTTLIERRVAFDKMAVFANVVGISVFATFFWTNAPVLMQQPPAPMAGAHLQPVALKKHPSIIHVVLDAYGAPDVLRDYYGHDNSAFRTALQEMGFTVMDGVTTPFNQTSLVMSSVMSGGYVSLPGDQDQVNVYRRSLGVRASGGTVHTALRQSGYKFYYTPSGYAGLDLDDATRVDGALFWAPTQLDARMFNLSGHAPLTVYNRMIKSAFDPENFTELAPPFYYYQHVLAPHPPFSLTEDGALRETTFQTLADGSDVIHGSAAVRADYIEGYRQKARFTEKALLNQLRSRPDQGDVVIIIHGDHGPGAFLDQARADNTCVQERMNSFLAVYSNVPEVQQAFSAQQGKGFNLVNIYRVLFAALSDEDIALLPSRSTFVPFLELAPGHNVSAAALTQACQ